MSARIGGTGVATPPDDTDVEGGAPGRVARLRAWTATPAGVGVTLTLVLLAVVTAANHLLFTQALHESGDFAANSLLVDRATHLALDHGNYSRVGFYHPGPGLLYVLAAGQLLFHDLLHLVPAPFNGQVLALIVLACSACGVVAATVATRLRSALAGALTGAVVAVSFAAPHAFAVPWMPRIYLSVFLVFVVACADVGTGRTRGLPVFVVTGVLLVHGHVSFLLHVGVGTLAVLAGWWWSHRGAVRAELGAHRRVLLVSGGLLALGLLPLVVALVTDWPGPWPKYLSFGADSTGGHSVADAAHFTREVMTPTTLGVVVTGVSALVVLVVALRERDAARRRWLLAVLVATAAAIGVSVFYAARGVDALTPLNRYTLYVVRPLPALLLATAVTAVLPHLPARRVLGAAGLVAAAVVFLLGPSVVTNVRQETDPDAVAMAAVLRSHAVDGRVAIKMARPSLWPAVVGAVLAASREGVDACVSETEPNQALVWSLLFTEQHVCPQVAGRPVLVAQDPRDGPVGPTLYVDRDVRWVPAPDYLAR